MILLYAKVAYIVHDTLYATKGKVTIQSLSLK